ncbi:MAG: hypothetical protein NTY81_02220 [Candidatus Staskawiczbacteria bacterium]|nr:hypothetical protein [Candidatus Staskawiczbacteria bacterium]
MPAKRKKKKEEKGEQDLRKLARHVLDLNFKFGRHLDRALNGVETARRERLEMEREGSAGDVMKMARRSENRRISGLTQMILGPSATHFQDLQIAFIELTAAVASGEFTLR